MKITSPSFLLVNVGNIRVWRRYNSRKQIHKPSSSTFQISNQDISSGAKMVPHNCILCHKRAIMERNAIALRVTQMKNVIDSQEGKEEKSPREEDVALLKIKACCFPSCLSSCSPSLLYPTQSKSCASQLLLGTSVNAHFNYCNDILLGDSWVSIYKGKELFFS